MQPFLIKECLRCLCFTLLMSFCCSTKEQLTLRLGLGKARLRDAYRSTTDRPSLNYRLCKARTIRYICLFYDFLTIFLRFTYDFLTIYLRFPFFMYHSAIKRFRPCRAEGVPPPFLRFAIAECHPRHSASRLIAW